VACCRPTKQHQHTAKPRWWRVRHCSLGIALSAEGLISTAKPQGQVFRQDEGRPSKADLGSPWARRDRVIACSRPRPKRAMDLEASRPLHMGKWRSKVGERVAEVEVSRVRRLRLASATLACFPHITDHLTTSPLSSSSSLPSPSSHLIDKSPAKHFCLKAATCRPTTRSGTAAISNLAPMSSRVRYSQGLTDGIRQAQLDGPRMNGYQPAIVSVPAPVCYFRSLPLWIVSW